MKKLRLTPRLSLELYSGGSIWGTGDAWACLLCHPCGGRSCHNSFVIKQLRDVTPTDPDTPIHPPFGGTRHVAVGGDKRAAVPRICLERQEEIRPEMGRRAVATRRIRAISAHIPQPGRPLAIRNRPNCRGAQRLVAWLAARSDIWTLRPPSGVEELSGGLPDVNLQVVY